MDLTVLDGVHGRAPRDHFHPVASPHMCGVRSHHIGTCLPEVAQFNLDEFERRPELFPEGLQLVMAAIDTLQWPSRTRPVNFRIGPPQDQDRGQIALVPCFVMAPHDLHVLLRHRLLPQPGGCEGLGLASAVPPPRHFALMPLAYLPQHLLKGHTALETMTMNAQG